MTIQITISLDTTRNLHLEAPGLNGARKKLETTATPARLTIDNLAEWISENRFTIADELVTQLTRAIEAELRAKETARAIATTQHNDNVTYVAEYHPGILGRIYPGAKPRKSGSFFTPGAVIDGGIKKTKEELYEIQAAKVKL